MARVLLWSSAAWVHDSQAYRKMDVTRKHISYILELREQVENSVSKRMCWSVLLMALCVLTCVHAARQKVTLVLLKQKKCTLYAVKWRFGSCSLKSVGPSLVLHSTSQTNPYQKENMKGKLKEHLAEDLTKRKYERKTKRAFSWEPDKEKIWKEN